jgi:dTDP-4-dehydrorhamnose reductase
MRIFITGIRGHLGQALQNTLTEHEVSGVDLPECDITQRSSIQQAITTALPDLVIHSAAMTDVEGCARDPEQAYRTNGMGTQNVVLSCQETGADLLYVSTNEVFDGTAERPYLEFDSPHPVNPYGRSKLAGEWFTSRLLTRFYIVRTAWLYAPGGRNFSNPQRIIQLADERGQLQVVTDEIGSPTYALHLARAIGQLITTEQYGIYHFVNEGVCSRFDFVREVLRLADRDPDLVEPTTLDAFERHSTPPCYSPLANVAGAALGIRLPTWEEALLEYLETDKSSL